MPVTYSAHGVLPSLEHVYLEGVISQMPLDALWGAWSIRKNNGDLAAIAHCFNSARWREIHAMNLFYANLSSRVETLWLHFLNKYLAYFHPSKYRISLALGRSFRFARLQAENQSALPKQTNGPLVSVLMPLYNAGDTLEFAAASILSQTWQRIELLLIDDCSSDHSLEVAHALARHDARVKVIPLIKNGGPYIAKNVALSVALGDYITVHDADDWAFPTRIEDQLMPLLASKELKVSMGYMLRMSPEGEVTRFTPACSYSPDGALRYCHPSLLFERRYFETRLGAWDSVRIGADTEIIERIMHFEPNRMAVLEIPVMLQLDLANSLTRAEDTYIDERGASPIRIAYRQAWENWHNSNHNIPRLAFPQVRRAFAVPEGLQVHSLGADALVDGATRQ